MRDDDNNELRLMWESRSTGRIHKSAPLQPCRRLLLAGSLLFLLRMKRTVAWIGGFLRLTILLVLIRCFEELVETEQEESSEVLAESAL